MNVNMNRQSEDLQPFYFIIIIIIIISFKIHTRIQAPQTKKKTKKSLDMRAGVKQESKIQAQGR